ncbi:MAG: class I SAM-dependent methyltransferase [Magnetococcales bacterium]|nr:class I SAM-dependent methyltransferase [Magnetococcales bacterium]
MTDLKQRLKTHPLTAPLYQRLYYLYYKSKSFTWTRLRRALNPSQWFKRLRNRKNAFDYRYGVDTSGRIDMLDLDINSPNRFKGVEYQGTHEILFKAVMDLPAIPKENTLFIDLGAGKGRALLLASFHPFARILGVEFAKQLCDIAQNNFRKFRDPAQRCTDLAIIHLDVTEYHLPDEPLLIYMSNPFNREIMQSVVIRIEERIQRSPAPVTIVYGNPRQVDVLNASPWLLEVSRTALDGASDPRVHQVFTVHRGHRPGA